MSVQGLLLKMCGAAGGGSNFPTPDIAWYEPNDIGTLFQDAAMTIPVTAPGQTVQAVEDVTGNGNDIVWTSAGTSLTYESDVDEGSRLEFNNQFLEKANFAGLNGQSRVTIVNCWRIDSATGAGAAAFEIQDSGGVLQFVPYAIASISATRPMYVPTPASQQQDTSNIPLFGVFVVEILEYDGTQVAQADRMLITQNGKIQLNNTLANIASAVSANPIRFRLFGRAIGSNYAVGSWWGTMVFGRILTADEKDILFQYYYDKRMLSDHYLPDPGDWYQFGTTEGNASVLGGPNPYTVPKPADVGAGDFVLRIRIAVSGSAESASNVPWRTLANFSSGSTNLVMSIAYRQADANEPANYTFTKSTGAVHLSILARIRGGVIRNATAVNPSAGASSGNTVTLSVFTPVLVSEGVLLFAVQWINTVSVLTPPAGMTLVMDDIVPTVPNASRVQVYMEVLTSGAAVGPRTLTFTGNTQFMALGAVLA